MNRLALRFVCSLLLFVPLIGVQYFCLAQPAQTKVQLLLIPDHSDGLYRVGESVRLKVIALDCGMPLNDITIAYEISEDLMPAHKSDRLKLKGHEGSLSIGTLQQPGFLRIRASVQHEGKKYISLCTVGFDTDRLTPTTQLPEDFDQFWDQGLAELAKVDLNPTMERMPERCTDKVDVYHISYRNIRNSRMYGVLTVPKAAGTYPAILQLPGAGVGAKSGDIRHAEEGVIVLQLGIHGIPVNLEGSVYSDLSRGILANYPEENLHDRDNYFYRRVYLGAVKGIDFLLSLPQCNGVVGTMGGSQGGALSIVVSRLHPRVNATAIYFPALCDVEGYLHGRAGGWPHMFKNPANHTQDKITTARYYDAANFARGLKAPVHYIYGYNDIVCAPTTTCATYNIIPAPKQVIIGENIGHWTFPEQIQALWSWLIDTLKNTPAVQ